MVIVVARNLLPRDPTLFALDQLAEQLAHLALGGIERLAARRGGAIQLSQRFAIAQLSGFQIALLFEPVQQRIKTPGANAVTMPGKLFDHPETEDGLFDGVVQDVQPDEAGVEIAVGSKIVQYGFRSRHTIT